MRVKFKRDRNWTPPEERRITVAYKKDMELTIKREWGEQMVKDGDCVEIDPPARHPLDHDNDGRKGGSLPRSKGTAAQVESSNAGNNRPG